MPADNPSSPTGRPNHVPIVMNSSVTPNLHLHTSEQEGALLQGLLSDQVPYPLKSATDLVDEALHGDIATSTFLSKKLPPDQVSITPKSATAFIDQALHDVVTSAMPCTDIVAILTRHGCTDLTSSLDESACSSFPIANGGLGDVFRGRLINGMTVAIKTIRAYYDQGQLSRAYHKRAAREIYTWSKCKHPNVVELIGLAVFRECLAMISHWEENGTLLHYLSKHPSADRCHLSTSICAGLVYLHENDIVHGDLKGANILIAGDGRPMLMDFGNASLLDATLQFTQTNTGPSFSLRWTASFD
ncbi:unnamed protein product [Rhizoctonia solani]|uniref:Protein kinase domain-containing protein n=1 Tax=Rhizoctonia solani TaxID=456999 RepID=A0A8H3DT52_9AGAM|nr:unnamed protein product [Rhizoctonia solani]